VEHDFDQRLSHREAGSTAVQEVAFTFANAIAYVQSAIDAGLDVNRFGQRLCSSSTRTTIFSKRLRSTAPRGVSGANHARSLPCDNPRAQQLRFHTQTAGQR